MPPLPSSQNFWTRLAAALAVEDKLPRSSANLAGDAGATRENLTPAAVLVPLVDHPQGVTLLLTRRTAHLRDHPGQISFPGGSMDPADPTPIAAALREAREEIGLAPEAAEILGELPPYATVTGFLIHPVVARLVPPLALSPAPEEVEEIFEAPLEFLLNPENHRRDSLVYKGERREYLAIPYGHYYIWGATAGMIAVLAERFRELPA
jgi:8-oxo-dGTP pyrophosphatase MutT (NUDIX family)